MHTTTTIAAQITRPRTFSLQLHTSRVLWLHLHGGVLKASTSQRSVPRSLPVGCQANSAGRAAAVQTKTGSNQERVWLLCRKLACTISTVSRYRVVPLSLFSTRVLYSVPHRSMFRNCGLCSTSTSYYPHIHTIHQEL